MNDFDAIRDAEKEALRRYFTEKAATHPPDDPSRIPAGDELRRGHVVSRGDWRAALVEQALARKYTRAPWGKKKKENKTAK